MISYQQPVGIRGMTRGLFERVIQRHIEVYALVAAFVSIAAIAVIH